MTSASTYSNKTERPSAETLSPPTSPSPTPEEVLNLPQRPSPLEEESCLLHGKQPAAGQVVVLNSQIALELITAHSQSNLDVELGGVLLGHAYREGDTLAVDVLGALPAVSDDHSPVHFTFTADAWSQIHRDRSAQYPHLEIVGWFHTHPGLSVFYSSDDVVVHSAAFTLPWHIGLVVDPIRREAAYFGWLQGEIAPINGYYELTDIQKQPITNLKAVRTSVYDVPEVEMWESAHASAPVLDQSNTVYMPANQRLILNPSSQKLGLIIGSLALALAIFLLLFWIIPQNRRATELETVLLTLADSQINPNAQLCPDSRLRLLSPMMGTALQVGTEFDILGTAVYPEAVRYRVETRPTGQEQWKELGSRKRGDHLLTLATWNTTNHSPGKYDVRLTAVDRNNIRLPNSPPCLINLELVP
ncbi:MAG: hypothetical protein GY796_35055 [Chloroflexi bacterium]|nr:hypothetical protein [Chloroflexota bacterium]